jgi:hypothetical protein
MLAWRSYFVKSLLWVGPKPMTYALSNVKVMANHSDVDIRAKTCADSQPIQALLCYIAKSELFSEPLARGSRSELYVGIRGCVSTNAYMHSDTMYLSIIRPFHTCICACVYGFVYDCATMTGWIRVGVHVYMSLCVYVCVAKGVDVSSNLDQRMDRCIYPFKWVAIRYLPENRAAAKLGRSSPSSWASNKIAGWYRTKWQCWWWSRHGDNDTRLDWFINDWCRISW